MIHISHISSCNKVEPFCMQKKTLQNICPNFFITTFVFFCTDSHVWNFEGSVWNSNSNSNSFHAKDRRLKETGLFCMWLMTMKRVNSWSYIIITIIIPATNSIPRINIRGFITIMVRYRSSTGTKKASIVNTMILMRIGRNYCCCRELIHVEMVNNRRRLIMEVWRHWYSDISTSSGGSCGSGRVLEPENVGPVTMIWWWRSWWYWGGVLFDGNCKA